MRLKLIRVQRVALAALAALVVDAACADRGRGDERNPSVGPESSALDAERQSVAEAPYFPADPRSTSPSFAGS